MTLEKGLCIYENICYIKLKKDDDNGNRLKLIQSSGLN